jgi:hypothetical protein
MMIACGGLGPKRFCAHALMVLADVGNPVSMRVHPAALAGSP